MSRYDDDQIRGKTDRYGEDVNAAREDASRGSGRGSAADQTTVSAQDETGGGGSGHKNKKRRRLKNWQFTLLLFLLVLAGCALMVYPWFANRWNEAHMSRAIMTYSEAVDSIPEEEYEKLLSDAASYNERLAREAFARAESTEESEGGAPSLSDLSRVVIADASQEEQESGDVSDNTADAGENADQAQASSDQTVRTGHFNWTLSEEDDAEYNSLLNYEGDGIMGYITIDKIDVNIPIYHGTDDSVLQTATGHLEGSSLPVGGPSTHSVIAGHRGLPSAKIFTDLDQLTIGDTFVITILNQKLTYEVDQITMVDPTDFSDLGLVEGKDYCTLLTCTPYGINTQRLLVRGTRIDNIEEAESELHVPSDAEEIIAREQGSLSYKIRQFLNDYAPEVALVLAALFLLEVIILNARGRKNSRRDR